MKYGAEDEGQSDGFGERHAAGSCAAALDGAPTSAAAAVTAARAVIHVRRLERGRASSGWEAGMGLS